jgi:4,5-DOPA dioxygenase extradiol
MSSHACTPEKAPVIFVSHGAPTLAIEPGLIGPRLNALGARLLDIKAVLVVSPHWQTRGVHVMETENPETVYDFGGFPSSLYSLKYPAPGQPQLARMTAQLLEQAGYSVTLDRHQGFDHGAWVPLRFLLPQATIPVFQVSMPHDMTAQQAVEFGRALAPMREQGVLILASGSLTHNLHEFRQHATEPASYAEEFAAWMKAAVSANAVNAVAQYRTEAPHAERAHPTEEHFLPLLVALGAQGEGDQVQTIEGGIRHGVLSMDAFAWGLPDAPAAPAGLSYQVRQPAPFAPTKCLFLLHGVGGNETNLMDFAESVDPHTLVVFVQGPLQLGAGQFAWFRVAFTANGPSIVPEEAESSRLSLIALVQKIQKQHAVSAEKTVIAGFSQGGIMSASVALSAPDIVGRFAILSGRILPELAPHIAEKSALQNLDAFVGHGEFDSKLPVFWAQRSDQWLNELGVAHTLKLYPIDHGISPAMQADFMNWLNG